MKILHVNQVGRGGGAAGICLALHQACLGAGHRSAVLVGRGSSGLPGVAVLEHDRYRNRWGRSWMAAARRLNRYAGRIPGAYRASERWLPRMAAPAQFRSWWVGKENFDFPGTRHLLEQSPFQPEVLQLHNLHGDYFDLRELPQLSRAVPTIVTLHDAWLLGGHCAHACGCQNWKTGCVTCPDLSVFPEVRRDAAHFNWQRKRRLFKESRLTLVCPARWLAERVGESMLLPAATRLEVIENGVDTAVFRPGSRAAARERLGWPQDAFVVLFAGVTGRSNCFKDFATMREAVRLAASGDIARSMRFYVVGGSAPAERAGAASIEFLPYRDSMAECYQAADVYLHAAKIDTFPTTVLEAMACGVPVVATAVGGIPEQIVEGETGFLVRAGDAPALASRVARLAHSAELVRTLGVAAGRHAADHFSQKRMAARYLSLYRDVSEQTAGPGRKGR